MINVEYLPPLTKADMIELMMDGLYKSSME